MLLVIASVQLPFLVCWLFAATGWLYFRQYVSSLPGNAADRRGYRLLLWGLLVLILGLIVPSLIRAVYANYAGVEPGPVHTWVRTYSTLIFPLIGFFLASVGSAQLLESLKLKVEPWYKSMTAIIPMAVFAVFYLSLIFTNPARQISSNPAIPATYYLPDLAIILTIVIPVIATWAFGFRMVLNLEHYSHYVDPQHKPALINIYNGALTIIGSVILQQVLASLGPSRLTGLNLGLILTLVYILLLVIGIGYALIARGAKQLAVAGAPKVAD